MKRKRALKILMGAGMSRNDASRFIREPFAVENDAKVFVGLYRMAVRKSHVHIMADGDKTFIRFIPKNKRPRCYEACGVQDCSFNYRSAPLFPQKAVRLYEDIVKFVTEAVICARTMEVWLLEDLSLVIVSNYSVLSGGEFTTEYRTVKAWEFQKGLLCIEPDTLTEKLMELCAPFYSHYDQTYYEL